MASKTKKTKLIRKRKDSKNGQKRKKVLRNHGTTKSYQDLFSEK